MASSVEPSLRDRGEDDWAVQAANTVEKFVGTISDKTAGPLTTVARALVFGLFAAFVGTVALLLAVMAAVRFLDIWLKIWAVYAVLGGIFVLFGWLVFRKRRPRGA